MTITDISPQKKNKERVNIFLDGSFAFGCNLLTATKYHLKIDQEISSDLVQKIISENELSLIYSKLLNLISRRPRSKKEILDYLHKREIGEMVETAVIKKLEENKYLDDVAFAQWFLNQRQTFRPKGKKFISYELRQKGISADIIAQVLESSDVSEVDQAKKLIEKKLPLWQNLPEIKRKQKIQEYLMRRGFGWEVIKEVVISSAKNEDR